MVPLLSRWKHLLAVAVYVTAAIICYCNRGTVISIGQESAYELAKRTKLDAFLIELPKELLFVKNLVLIHFAEDK